MNNPPYDKMPDDDYYLVYTIEELLDLIRLESDNEWNPQRSDFSWVTNYPCWVKVEPRYKLSGEINVTLSFVRILTKNQLISMLKVME